MKIREYNSEEFEMAGVWSGMPMREYLEAPCESASRLKLILESPLTYHRKRGGLIQDETTPAMNIGTALHSVLLEGNLDYYVKPTHYANGEKPWNGNATECKAWIASHQDKPIITEAELDYINSAACYVQTHHHTSGLLNGGNSELSVFARIKGRLFKGRFDYFKQPGIIVDLKTVTDASSRRFGQAVINYGWHMQASLYMKLASAVGVAAPKFFWVALQKGDMPLVNVKMHGDFSKMLGDEAMAHAMNILDKCEATGTWPEWADDDEGCIKPLRVPQWALNQGDDEIDLNG